MRDVLDEYPLSSVIRLSNMTTPADLTDNDLYEELLEDVADECNTHGTVKSIVIPRGLDGAEDDGSVVRTYKQTYTYIHTYIHNIHNIHDTCNIGSNLCVFRGFEWGPESEKRSGGQVRFHFIQSVLIFFVNVFMYA